MARCRKCNTIIPDGTEYCSKCEKENKESYLDSLLNSVAPEQDVHRTRTAATGQRRVQPKQTETEKKAAKVKTLRKVASENDMPELNLPEFHMPELDLSDLEMPDLSDETGIETYDILGEEDQAEDELDRMFQELLQKNDISADTLKEDARLFDEMKEEKKEDEEYPAAESVKEVQNEQTEAENEAETEAQTEEEAETENILAELDLQDILENSASGEEDQAEDGTSEEAAAHEDELADLMNGLLTDDFSELPEEEPGPQDAQEESEPPAGPDIPMDFEMDEETSGEDGSEEEEQMSEDSLSTEDSDMSESMKEESAAEDEVQDDDILELINSIQNADYEEDGKPASERMSGDGFGTEEELENGKQPSDMAGVFDDVLGAVDSLSDDEQEDIINSIPDLAQLRQSMESEEREAKGKEAKSKEAKQKKEKKPKKPGLLKRIFGNIKGERSEEEIAQLKEKILKEAEDKEKTEEEKKKKAAADKEAKKKKAAEDKAAAAKKKQEDAKKKAEAAKLKKDEKEKKKQELQNLIDEIDEDEGRINRVGASIIFVIFAAAAAFIIIGTRIYSYAANIAIAERDFENQHYNEAYEEVAGLDIQDEDQTFYLQVMTVMYTYKQLNSYNRYYSIGMYPEALDSLLKGLQRYDKYSALASVIEIENDMNFVKDEIIEQLYEVFGLSEREAITLAAMEDREAYSNRVYEIATSIPEAQESQQIAENEE